MSADEGLLKQMCVGAKATDIPASAKTLYDEITKKSAKKAEFALELLFMEDPDLLEIPTYIASGLSWLEGKLSILKNPLKGK